MHINCDLTEKSGNPDCAGCALCRPAAGMSDLQLEEQATAYAWWKVDRENHSAVYPHTLNERVARISRQRNLQAEYAEYAIAHRGG